METTNQKPKEAEQAPDEDTTPVAPYSLLYITRAYNRKEITFEEWLRQSREWAERMCELTHNVAASGAIYFPGVKL